MISSYLPWRTCTSSFEEFGQISSSITLTPFFSAFIIGTSLQSLVSWFPVRYELCPVYMKKWDRGAVMSWWTCNQNFNSIVKWKQNLREDYWSDATYITCQWGKEKRDFCKHLKLNSICSINEETNTKQAPTNQDSVRLELFKPISVALVTCRSIYYTWFEIWEWNLSQKYIKSSNIHTPWPSKSESFFSNFTKLV